jgi:hypothetical protein
MVQYYKLLNRFFRISFLLVFITCSSPKVQIKAELSKNTYWDELAELLAGIPLRETNRFNKIAKLPKYIIYSKKINSDWEQIEKNYLQKVKPWKKNNLPNLESPNTCVYPLGGVDFINLYQFCETSHKYVMIGLQKPGYILDPNNLKPEQVSGALPSIEDIIHEIAFLNYSTSRRMEEQSQNKHFAGIAPVILIFAKRFGFTIHSFKTVYLNENGLLVENTLDPTTSAPRKYSGFQIIMSRADEELIRELNFLKIFLKEDSMEQTSIEGKYLTSLGRLNLVFKSSEYILHLPEYTKFIKTLLNQTDRVVQDESGIPFDYYNPEIWNRKVFGKYIGKIELRNTPKVPFQENLNKEIKSNAGELPFPYGYGILRGKDKSNLLFLFRKPLNR